MSTVWQTTGLLWEIAKEAQAVASDIADRPQNLGTFVNVRIWEMAKCVAGPRLRIAAFLSPGRIQHFRHAQDFMAKPGAPAEAFPNPHRAVADIVSPIWRNEKERDDAGEAPPLVRLLGIKSGMTIADIGAGSGYYVERLSQIVGAHGRIIAEDIVPEYLREPAQTSARSWLAKRHDNSLASHTIPDCQPNRPDIAILVHMYHEIAEPYALLYNLVPALKSGARVGIIDTFKPTPEHGTPPSVLRCELAAVGYREIRLNCLTGSDAYLGIFAPPSLATRIPPEAMVACDRDGDLRN